MVDTAITAGWESPLERRQLIEVAAGLGRDAVAAVLQLRGTVPAVRHGDDAMVRAVEAVKSGSRQRIAASAGVSTEGVRAVTPSTPGDHPLLEQLRSSQRWVAAAASREAPPPENARP